MAICSALIYACALQLRFVVNIFNNSGMVAAFSLEEWRLSTFIACVASGHHDNPYHNLATACYVLQATYLVLHAARASAVLPQTAQLALLLAALCHDLDHDGKTTTPFCCPLACFSGALPRHIHITPTPRNAAFCPPH